MIAKPRNVYWLWLSAIVILVDQVTKQLVVKSLAWYEVRPVLPHFNLIHAKNTGAAFSMLSNTPPVAFVLIGVGVSIGIMWWMRSNPRGQTFAAIGFALILGGALGNVIDRALRGHVIDFVDFFVGDWHFAAFNVADTAISIGAACLILDMFIPAKPQPAPPQEH